VTGLVIRHGSVLDGTGAAPRRADVAIEHGRITQIGDVPLGPAELDAAGRLVAPGFIDIHSHSDYTLLVDPRAVSAVHQGVTLEVIGNCGHGCFPIRDESLAARAIYGHSDAVPVTWSTAAGYFERLEEARPAVNVLSLVPNGQLRLAAVGLEDRPARPHELSQMQRLLEQALDEGAWGYSSASSTRRSAGRPRRSSEPLPREREARQDLPISHAAPRRRLGGGGGGGDPGGGGNGDAAPGLAPDPAQRARRRPPLPRGGRRRRLFRARRRLRHAYPALRHDLPPHRAAARRARGAPATAGRAARRPGDAVGGPWVREHPQRRPRQGRIVLLDNPVVPGYARQSIAAIADERGQEPTDAICDLLAAALPDTARLMVINHCNTEAQQREAFGHRLCMPGSDATTLAPDGPLRGSVFHGAYTWAAWFYRFTVQQERLFERPRRCAA
jgi:N-acyl-D-amino-acid deacylase